MTAVFPAADSVIEAACAKVNLTLHVTGRRANGYHDLDSLVVFSGAHDTLIACPAEGLSLAMTGPTAALLDAEDDNIILRAARRLAERAGHRPDARLTLIKRLPVAAGIGGGSADGAATLRALSRLWKIALPQAEMLTLAAELGADVPVCLVGKAVTMAGIGDHLTPAPPLPEAWLLLVNPRRAVPTPQVFKARQGGFSAANPLTESPASAQALAEALKRRTNDLAEPARRIEPVIDEVLRTLAALPGCLLARMSGSGATCFGLFADQTSADFGMASLRETHGSWWASADRLIGDTARVPAALAV
ncbi:4-(cytidine 5'-diphospho)-2-C-methyl-D-erythritol kinase [Rhodospirillum rubrum]|uniref:4-diphosphocytidyl-2-C-methyl-D-erythritol kinase n=1 Tax=Rhodospirillum rubrum (strain ATCC 11170 / ATH 1.1.1 / DSM 467 / LMG 4362 / NCIMB 8255 / S1) TaxID=269796 RepID=ISPE_RHORT|nr:4-(cytidine 5'-diphospho)-2-C-methyl-D-erythritol kinase [Rhodospirillum rubrum]Q2RXS7.1 RecName: Full=4-diphosphocytidyl-2-C-methyl-D-erythritol kinase; Short=CMK; AltName: Full=4-(cytidine-5'-diphospho)-2-C-methyl-D-erythritol kinase [Rhodospirillum rubrum ATCC 11170]ABC21068.1 4-diphosphocytidyl-2-C-methyl-D-erythritol kinase [Rhodospirillum rubrum ATCC 11170]AEO46736.1 4-diphosphocytidyl-2-C-methyl-D-erythritol kinase [Rhodospirillum rubrum F11]MBK5952612.1 4-diphosphocytidyl-2C-methyl-D